jgi:hypothetical protein
VVVVLACAQLVLVVLDPPVARATTPSCCTRRRPTELSPVLVVVLACHRSPLALTPMVGIDRPWPPHIAKRMFQVFKMVYRYVVNVSYRCCTCYNSYTRMLQVLYLDIAYVVMAILQVYVLNVLSVFRCLLQLFHLCVAKLDLIVG